MSFLALVLVAKIGVTGLFVGLPFFALPATRISAATGYDVGSAPLFRLYGTAIFALLIGYASGFWAIAQGVFPWGVVAMGLFSNGVGAAMLYGTGAWRQSRLVALFIAAIAAALLVAAAFPHRAIMPLW